MANGRFSQPRPDREEEREIEEAFRQVTGQTPAPTPHSEHTGELDIDSFDLVFDEEALRYDTPPVPPPVSQAPAAGFGVKALLLLERAVDYCEKNRKVVLVALCAVALILILGFMGIFFASTTYPYEKNILLM